MLEYATVSDIWPEDAPEAPEAPDDAADLTLHANLLVSQATRGAVYATTADGFPSNTLLRKVFTDAVTAQVRFWHENSLRPQDGPVGVASERAVVSKSIGSAQLSYENPEFQREAQRAALTGLCATAHYLLSNAGLLNGQPRRR